MCAVKCSIDYSFFIYLKKKDLFKSCKTRFIGRYLEDCVVWFASLSAGMGSAILSPEWGLVGEGFGRSSTSVLKHVDGQSSFKGVLSKGGSAQAETSWLIMKWATAQAGNRASKIARRTQWEDSWLECQTHCSGRLSSQVQLPTILFRPIISFRFLFHIYIYILCQHLLHNLIHSSWITSPLNNLPLNNSLKKSISHKIHITQNPYHPKSISPKKSTQDPHHLKPKIYPPQIWQTHHTNPIYLSSTNPHK